MNKKIVYILISIFSLLLLSSIIFYFVNQGNYKRGQKIEAGKNNQPQNTEDAYNDFLNSNLIKSCDTKDCILVKFKKCESFQYNYNKERSLYFAVLDKNPDNNKCRTVLDLSLTKVLACELEASNLNDKNFDEILSASTKNISYLKSIGCNVLQ